MNNETGYTLWKSPTDANRHNGEGSTVIPGFGQWILLHPHKRPHPIDAIPVERVVDFLEAARGEQ